VNAGSNDVTVFSVQEAGLVWKSKTPSGGTTPISVTIHNDHVVVLNSGGSANISAFRLENNGTLVPVVSRALNGSAPAEVAFNRDGSLLAVTEKTSNTIDLFVVDQAGVSAAHTSVSHGATPFGFAFTKKDRLIVTEAAGGPNGTSAVSSYVADDDNGMLSLITGSLPDTQEATCWAVATENGRYAFVANTHSGTISSIGIDHTGGLTLLNGVAGNPGTNSLPGDLALTEGSRFLYALTPGNGAISEFRVGADGTLDAIGSASGVPASAAGLAAR
jgi:6-phosphogluconolactonase (cycloisomerase 2 family)